MDPGQGRPAGLLGLLASAVLRLLGVGWISLRFVVGLFALLARGVPEIVGCGAWGASAHQPGFGRTAGVSPGTGHLMFGSFPLTLTPASAPSRNPIILVTISSFERCWICKFRG